MKQLSAVIFFAIFALTSSSSTWKSSNGPMPAVPDQISNGLGLVISLGLGLALFGAGILFLLFGLKFFRAIIFISGFSTVFLTVFGVMGGFTLITNSQPGPQLLVDLLLSVGLGIAGGYLALFCHKLSVFLVGFACGGAILAFLTAIASDMKQESMGFVVLMGMIGGIIGGILAVKIYDQVIILITSFGGAALIVTSFSILMSGGNFAAGFAKYPFELAALAVLLAIAGVIYQNKTRPPKVQDGTNSKLINSPELMMVNVHYQAPLGGLPVNGMNQQPSAYYPVSQIPANGMNAQQQAYYNPAPEQQMV